MDGIVSLNVGGCLYATTLLTVTRYPDSMLGAMFSGELDPSRRDANGAFVIDGDGPVFRHILNFLRRGRLILPKDFQEWDLLESEADFYQLEALSEAVKAEKYRRFIPEDAIEENFEFIEISVCENLSYKYIGSEKYLKSSRDLTELLLERDILVSNISEHNRSDGRMQNTTYTIQARPDSGSDFQAEFERRKGSIFREITTRHRFKMKRRSYTTSPSGAKEFKWTFSKFKHL
ncbi:BTB/POZ domain-containing protein KCTD6-like [Acanthaster planci]|uniref:BTB/POZ domain-containing protein KCTD6-like n=1 Tax=Acanthaster planci TaxID=133434 RepID=A0A8B8A5P4_ACAPL|nr:BTB/POZ domain-containing protein KCTD6-like [Acanthaster planci]